MVVQLYQQFEVSVKFNVTYNFYQVMFIKLTIYLSKHQTDYY